MTPVPQRKRALEKIKAAHVARHSPSAKLSITGYHSRKFFLFRVSSNMQLDVNASQSPLHPNSSLPCPAGLRQAGL